MIDFLQQSGDEAQLRLAQRLDQCATYRRNGLKSGKVPNYCNLRFLCSSCSERMAAKKARQFSATIQQLMFRFDLIALMLTLKPKPSDSLSVALRRLETHLQRIRQRRKNFLAGRTSFTEFCRPRYLLLAIEIIRTHDNRGWFPHVHGLALTPRDEPDFNLRNLSQEWKELSGSPVRPHVQGTNAGRTFRKLQSSNRSSSEESTVSHQLRTVIQYSLKLPKLCVDDRLIVHNTVKRIKLIRQWPMHDSRSIVEFS